METRICTKCRRELTIDQFYIRSDDGELRKQCKKCCNANSQRWRENNKELNKKICKDYYEQNKERVKARTKAYYHNNKEKYKHIKRNYHLKENFNIDEDRYNEILSKQKNRCAICGQIGSRNLAVDHNHKYGNIRGLLCNNCNSAIGHFHENIFIMLKAICYLIYYNFIRIFNHD